MVLFQACMLLWTTLLREIRSGHHREPSIASRNRKQKQYYGFPNFDLFHTHPHTHTKMTLTKMEDKYILAGKGKLKQLALIQGVSESL